MKRKLGLPLTIIGIIIAVFLICFLYIARGYNVSLEGLKYQLGEEHAQVSESAVLKIDGKVKKSITGQRTFIGTIDISGDDNPVPKEHRKLEIKLQRDGSGIIIYNYNDKGIPVMYSYGTLYTNSNFSEVTIAIFDRKEQSSSGSWRAEDGLMFSAPANSRDEALAISNRRMSRVLQDVTLK
ncbi:hypothetical protein [Paenibacillus radicis (ex Gao et al. 2016)]|uniref:Uncharacterized protein n=1 Tax=Paenibacillus radicis (ex Gao et al. 2016) TaxID=1737354 RepID=A0A917M9I1_9BACL|nr:hypothetical protein [Paenibacillus radicis (ex Gao et al. 2016)]GGG83655.1 hypothetical protein GCM10010918_46700 [Paenibacillus radicis (ex Gao et al. 2016)]